MKKLAVTVLKVSAVVALGIAVGLPALGLLSEGNGRIDGE